MISYKFKPRLATSHIRWDRIPTAAPHTTGKRIDAAAFSKMKLGNVRDGMWNVPTEAPCREAPPLNCPCASES